MVESSAHALAGRYRLVKVRHRGPHGVVFAATDLQADPPHPCAVKRLYPQFHDAARLEGLLREAADAASLGHAAVLTPHDSGYDDDGALFLVSEMHPGESLRARLQRGPLGAAELLAVLVPVCEALEVAHAAGLAHGDLTPDNILVPRDGAGAVQLCDFGMHHLAASAGPGPALVGGAGYLPPEVYKGELPRASTESDQFALGALIYECLHARPLFEAPDAAALLFKICMAPLPPVTALAPAQRPRLEAIIAMACKRGQAVRFGGVVALLRALRAVLEEPAPPTQAALLASAETPPLARSAPITMRGADAPPQRDTLNSWLLRSGARGLDEGDELGASEASVTPPLGVAAAGLAPRWGNLAVWASAGGLVTAILLLVLRLGGEQRATSAPRRGAAALATAKGPGAPSTAQAAADQLSAAQARVAANDFAGALSELEVLARRPELTPSQRGAAAALQRAASDGMKRGLLLTGFINAAERGEIETAVALFQEMPAGSLARAQALPLYQALQRRYNDAHLAVARSALASGRCDEIAAQVEQLRRTALDPSDEALAEGLALQRRCAAPGDVATRAPTQAVEPALHPAGTPGPRRSARSGRVGQLKNPFE